jgi:hypothetical protein
MKANALPGSIDWLRLRAATKRRDRPSKSDALRAATKRRDRPSKSDAPRAGEGIIK